MSLLCFQLRMYLCLSAWLFIPLFTTPPEATYVHDDNGGISRGVTDGSFGAIATTDACYKRDYKVLTRIRRLYARDRCSFFGDGPVMDVFSP